jgi:hypothetical protein
MRRLQNVEYAERVRVDVKERERVLGARQHSGEDVLALLVRSKSAKSVCESVKILRRLCTCDVLHDRGEVEKRRADVLGGHDASGEMVREIGRVGGVDTVYYTI